MKIDFHFPGDDRQRERLAHADFLPRIGEEVSFGEERYRVQSVGWGNDGPGRVPTTAVVHLEELGDQGAE
jgi:hypothetical protein